MQGYIAQVTGEPWRKKSPRHATGHISSKPSWLVQKVPEM